MKICFACQVEKPFSDFYRHSKMKDGYLGKCKDCQKAAIRDFRRANPEKLRERDKQRAMQPARKKQILARQKKWQKRHKRGAVHSAVYRAKKAGILVPTPCEKCGCENVQAHHEDYTKPLEVRWLCKFHHQKEHGRI